MILADTSVWIEFLRGNEPYFSGLTSLMELTRVRTTDIIFGELLQGAKNARERNMIKSFWDYVPKANVSEIWIKAGEYASVHVLPQKGIGLIDAAIAVSAKETHCKIWSLDAKLLAFLKAESFPIY